MALARAVQPLNESTGLRPPSARSPPVQPASAQSANGCVAAAENHPSDQKCLELSHERDRTDAQSGAASSLASNAPTSWPSARRCSTCVCGTSSATLLLPTQWSVCCIDRLNPPPSAEVRTIRLAARSGHPNARLPRSKLSVFEVTPRGGCEDQPGAGMNRSRAMPIRVAHHCSVEPADAAGFDTGRAQHAILDVFRATVLRNASCMSWTRGALAFAAASRSARASAYICRMILLIRFPSSRYLLASLPSRSQDELQSFWSDCTVVVRSFNGERDVSSVVLKPFATEPERREHRTALPVAPTEPALDRVAEAAHGSLDACATAVGELGLRIDGAIGQRPLREVAYHV